MMCLEFNMLGADQVRFNAYFHPIEVEYIDISPDIQERDMSSPLAFLLPYGVTMLFYVLMITSASLLMNSITKEKENRVMEILVSTIKPKELLAGKILGLGLIGLLQMVVWMGSALLMLNLGGSILKVPPICSYHLTSCCGASYTSSLDIWFMPQLWLVWVPWYLT